jgi:pyruvate/2-oxoglutarate dehydrogenase complex dihydrolipoamide acyltransferase (E2) component
MARLSSPLLAGSVTALTLCLSVSASVCGCKNQAPPAAEATATESAASPPASAPTAAAAAADSAAAEPATDASDKFSEAGFDLVLQPKGTYTSGQAGEADIVLSAKAPFHVNQNYPYKFKLKEMPGLKFANLVVTKDAVKLEPARATVPVAFTPETAGKHTLAGQLSFSVCTDDKCMIEKRQLALDIDAK